jgi:hypothetical protein
MSTPTFDIGRKYKNAIDDPSRLVAEFIAAVGATILLISLIDQAAILANIQTYLVFGIAGTSLPFALGAGARWYVTAHSGRSRSLRIPALGIGMYVGYFGLVAVLDGFAMGSVLQYLLFGFAAFIGPFAAAATTGYLVAWGSPYVETPGAE